MSAPNFKTMQNFPLYARENLTCKICPECGASMGEDDTSCTECGASLEGVEATYDETAEYFECSDIEAEMKNVK